MKHQELFELCELVYKATGWDGGRQFAYDTTYADHWLRYIADFPNGTREKDLVDMVPLYDSDYLLGKLMNLEPWVGMTLTDGWCSHTKNWNVRKGGQHIERQASAVDALLELVIALDAAGELPRA